MARNTTRSVGWVALSIFVCGLLVTAPVGAVSVGTSTTDGGTTPAQLSNTTVTVDESGGADYLRIQAAIDNVSAGSTVEVRPGTYREAVTVDKSLTLTAPDGAVLNGSTLDSEASAVTIVGDAEPLISGFTITRYGTTGIDAQGTTGAWEATDLEIAETDGFMGTGVNAEGSSGNWVVSDTLVRDSYRNGVNARQSNGSWLLENVTVTDTVFGNGIRADESTGDWVMRNATVSDTRDDTTGIAVFETVGDWTITETTVVNNSRDGIEATNTVGSWRITNSTVAENGQFGVNVGGPATATTTGANWSIIGATIESNGDAGINAEEVTGPWRVHETRLVDNGVGVDATGAAERGAVERNWWGATDGPSGVANGSGDAATGNLSVTPYYTDSALTALSTASAGDGVDVSTSATMISPDEPGALRTELTNTGDTAVSTAVVFDDLAGVTVREADASAGTWDNDTDEWEIGALQAGASASLTLDVSADTSGTSLPSERNVSATMTTGETTQSLSYPVTVAAADDLSMTVGTVTAETGETVVIPIETEPVRGGVYYAGTVSFDASVVHVANVSMDDEDAFVWSEADNQNGTVEFGIESADYLTDPVVNVTFDVVGDSGTATAVNVSDRTVYTTGADYVGFPVTNGSVSVASGEGDTGDTAPPELDSEAVQQDDDIAVTVSSNESLASLTGVLSDSDSVYREQITLSAFDESVLNGTYVYETVYGGAGDGEYEFTATATDTAGNEVTETETFLIGTQSSNDSTIRLSVETPTEAVGVNDTAPVELVAGDVDSFVGAYEATVSVPAESGVRFTSANVTGSPAFSDAEYSENNTTVRLSAVGMETADGPSPDLAELTVAVDRVSGEREEQIPVTVSNANVSDENGTELSVESTENGTLDVVTLSAIGPSELPPTDPDGDGHYEDVNGDGNVTVSDVQALFTSRDDASVREQASLFDFNDNGRFNIVDIQRLFYTELV
ncbi:right-handed parallel beta-helix repeat-containing protein [Haloferax marisrubri]|uniref:right-handed parallel beta-helix repeat-containing protein n=1 Tax=Haloferax marisrubri TaxID=1544719 RepID=UPI000B0731D4|nr:right-handed parallel beta-helix repeat-containing protein [Haloferax marisrubri]